MSIKIGNLDINSFKVGNSDCKIYLGDTLLYPESQPHDYSQDYLTFVAKTDGTFKFSGNSVSYSVDNGSTWTELAANTASPTIASGNKIMWKATLTPSTSYPSYGIGTFSSTGNFNAEGNPMSLLYGDNFVGQTDLTGKKYAFYGLFSNCSKLISAKNLSLPATTLAHGCYNYMFQGCTSLTTAPELPATTLANYCYSNMFNGCTSLTTAPALPAITLVYGCYVRMFSDCTSLTTAPELPATTLANNCYFGMFSNCTNLTIAPELPATTLAERCYSNMFNGCKSLNTITCNATNISANNCTGSWVSGVSLTGTFYKNASMSSWPTGASGIPNGWTIEDIS